MSWLDDRCRHTETRCPHCDQILNASASMTLPDRTVQPYDLSICVYCGSFLQFDGELHLHVLSEAAFSVLDEGLRIEMQHVRALIMKAKKAGAAQWVS